MQNVYYDSHNGFRDCSRRMRLVNLILLPCIAAALVMTSGCPSNIGPFAASVTNKTSRTLKITIHLGCEKNSRSVDPGGNVSYSDRYFCSDGVIVVTEIGSDIVIARREFDGTAGYVRYDLFEDADGMLVFGDYTGS